MGTKEQKVMNEIKNYFSFYFFFGEHNLKK